MQLKPVKLVPLLITACALGFVCFLQALPGLFPKADDPEETRFDLFQRLEWLTYDARVRWALNFAPPYATNVFGAVFIDDNDTTAMNDGSLGYRFKFPWPRYFYGRTVSELSAQGASVVGLDILFDELDPDTKVRLPGNREIPSDAYFAEQLRRAGNVVLAAESKGGVVPSDFFQTNALAVGNVFAKKDSDSVLRRAKPFVEYRKWHPAVQRFARALNWNLARARVERDRIAMPRRDGEGVDMVPLASDGTLKFDSDGSLIVNPDPNAKESEGGSSKTVAGPKPFSDLRIWNLGLLLAAQQLKLDLDHAEIEPSRILLRGPGALERNIPLDSHGSFYIDWSFKFNDRSRIESESIVRLIRQNEARDEGQTNFPAKFKGKAVVVGSVGTGSNISDRGATPLEKETVMVSKYWNVANSVVMGRFITRSSYGAELLIILLFGLFSATLTWRLRVLLALGWVLFVALGYLALAVALYVKMRYWLPVFLPVAGGLLLPHFSLISYRVVFEQRERRRIKAVFAKVVSPDVVNELLSAERIALGGARRMLTVLFADVRGFTEFTDVSHANAEEYVRQHRLKAPEAEEYSEGQARECLNTVNLYLSLVADTVKMHTGTLDKYIGDCVMAFWGAPASNEKHALYCVRAAMEAQRAIYAVNQERYAENKRREQENVARISAGQAPRPLLPLLNLGSGINTGKMTVGLMGSDAHILNYTVFGREVNLASRLEGLSRRGEIIISEATYEALKHDAPELAATCLERPPVTVKGIRQPVKIYEVPWKTSLSGPTTGGAAPGAQVRPPSPPQSSPAI